MPGGHSEKTKLLGFFADRDLTRIVDKVRGAKGRSQFLREAVVEYMESHGEVIPAHLRNAPDRAGKGGPKKSNSSAGNSGKDISDQAVQTIDKFRKKKSAG
jgi:hypothetical protein